MDTARQSDIFFGKTGELFLTINGKTEDVSKKIRTPQIAEEVPKVASIGEIREIVTEKLRKMAESDDVIMDGRDIGTHVFPNAELKFFLKASTMERARRRLKDYEDQGISITVEEIAEEIDDRDKKDSEREHAPLRKAENAIEIDTTHLTIEEVISIIASKANN
ncbi:MAG: (d)CMP kinase [Denitrovibrio sp.]|nr:MAG: (d)CMP kinase [Denitrovibrio sp.]